MAKVILDINKRCATVALSDSRVCDDFWYVSRWRDAYNTLIKKVRYGSTIARVLVTRKEL